MARAENNSWPLAIFSAIFYSGHPNSIMVVSNCTDGQSKFHFGQPNLKSYLQLCMPMKLYTEGEALYIASIIPSFILLKEEENKEYEARSNYKENV